MTTLYPDSFRFVETPSAAVDYLAELYDSAAAAEKKALKRFIHQGVPPTGVERSRFCYPELRVYHEPEGNYPRIPRAYAKMSRRGVFTTTVTHPEDFRAYLVEQLDLLASDFEVRFQVGVSDQPIPYPYVSDQDAELFAEAEAAQDIALHFPVPDLGDIGDEIADERYIVEPGEPWPLALFDAARMDFSLFRLTHYSGCDWRAIQPWILLTNYHRYVDQFVRWAAEQLSLASSDFTELFLPGGLTLRRGESPEKIDALMRDTPWHRYQMPGYHLARRDGHGVSLFNIGVGPANAKTITDHLAVLRPHCWLMIGHCGGLRQSQSIGDYVLAHGYLRRDGILDDLVPPDIPVPALAEVQLALQEAAAAITGQHGSELKRRLRTGTVVTYDDRNWELRFAQERRRINLSRAIAVDMESGTVAAQGYRFRVPYGTLLCISDKPLHGEIKLPGAANAFYQRSIGEHFLIGLKALDLLRGQDVYLHSRKLRSFDEPPFR
jgi:AMP nucleosidase